MPTNRLKIVNSSIERSDSIPSRHLVKKQLEAKFERAWLIDPEQFNPLKNCLQKERLARSLALLSSHVDLRNKKITDIGCGSGVFTRLLRDKGAEIDAVDIATNALKKFADFDQTHIQTKQATMPDTRLSDDYYDVVVSLDLIAELPPQEYRLFFAELARVIKPDGYLLCSSSIDINSEDGVEKLLHLTQTEFEITTIKKSYHALFIRLKNILTSPSFYVKMWKDKKLRDQELKNRQGLNYYLFFLNTSYGLIGLWVILAFLASPFINWMKNKRAVLLSLENICQFVSDEKGISHLIFLAKRKPLQPEIASEDQPREHLKKREVWE